MPLSKGHLDWMAHIRKEASNTGIELSVCILEYGSYSEKNRKKKMNAKLSDLIPANPYPRQMSQGISALKHLLNSGYTPSEVGSTTTKQSIRRLTRLILDYFWRRLRGRPSVPKSYGASTSSPSLRSFERECH
jgi:hypothetical protein